MLRVGLTGGLGSGKSTAAALFAAHGAHILQSDAIGRQLMQPGQPVFHAIVDHFGPTVLLPNGSLDRAALARIAFTDDRVEELNAIVHPAVIAHQETLINEISLRDPKAVVIVESALIFETKHSTSTHGWRHRFHRIILVTAPEDVRIARFIARATSPGTQLTPQQKSALEEEAHRRLAQQIPDDQKAALADYILTNGGPLTELQWQVDKLWPILQTATA